MNKKAYKEAKDYTYFLDSKNYKDIVHDAWLKWFEKTGKDLFSEDRPLITRVIKNVIGTGLSTRKFMWRGKIYNKRYFEIWEDIKFEEDQHTFAGYTYVPYITETPEDILIYNDLCITLGRLTKGGMLEEMLKGGKHYLMAKELGISVALFSYYLQNLKRQTTAIIDGN